MLHKQTSKSLEEQVNETDISKVKSSKSSYLSRMMCTSLVALATLVGSALHSYATPVWSKINENTVGPYTDPFKGDIRRFEQQVKNDSTEGESLVEYKSPVGSNQGVVEAWINDDRVHDEWDVTIGTTQTVYTAKSGYAQTPGATPTFKLLTTDLDPAGDKEDLAQGIEGGEGFYFQRSTGELHLPVNLPGNIIQYTINVNAGSNGSVDKLGANQVNEGENLSLTFTANNGYVVENILTNGVPVQGIPKQKVVNWTWENIQSNGTVDSSYQLTPKSDGAIFYFR